MRVYTTLHRKQNVLSSERDVKSECTNMAETEVMVRLYLAKDRYVMVKPYPVTQRCDGQVIPGKNKDVMVKLYLAKIEM